MLLLCLYSARCTRTCSILIMHTTRWRDCHTHDVSDASLILVHAQRRVKSSPASHAPGREGWAWGLAGGGGGLMARPRTVLWQGRLGGRGEGGERGEGGGGRGGS